MKKVIFVITIFCLIGGGFFYPQETQASEGFWTSFIETISQQIRNAGSFVAELITRVNPFQAGPIVELPEEEPEKAKDEPKEEKEKEEKPLKPDIDELQEDLDDILEEIDIIEQGVFERTTEREFQEIEEEIEEEEVDDTPEDELVEPEEEEPEEPLEPEETEEELEEATEITCAKKTGDFPSRFRVLINEVAWAGTENSINDEWIELKNIWGIPVNLAGWHLLDKDGQIQIAFSEDDVIPPNSYYLLERTDDDSVPGVSADLIYSGALNNNDEALYLLDNNCKLEDEVKAQPDWPASDSFGKRSMERFDNFYWYSYNGSAQNGVLGSPKKENSTPPQEYLKPAIVTGTKRWPPVPPILIAEIQIETTASKKYDFIELHNLNDQDTDISGWQLKKKTSSGKEYSVRVFPDGSIIGSREDFLWANDKYVESGLILADVISKEVLDEDNSVALFNKDGKIVDALAWGTSTDPFVEGESFLETPSETQSLARKWSTTSQKYVDTNNNQEDFELQTPTPGTRNQSSIPEPEEDISYEVLINEIAWAGTAAYATDEWIELYNNASSSVDIDGWRLSSSDVDGLDIIFSSSTSATTTIEAQGFYLLERDDDNTISDITASWVGSFGDSLSDKKCEILSLYDNNGNLIDETACSKKDWPGGEASPNYISMERISSASGVDPTNWGSNNLLTKNGQDADGNPINGTPKAKNSVSY